MANRSGWTYGERIPQTSEFLTVLGSAYRAPVLYGTQAEAQAALDAFGPAPHMRLEVAHVTERAHGGVSGRGYAYRITGAPASNWQVPARDVRPGDVWRSLGPGYLGREVTAVAHMCNCQAVQWIGGPVDTVTGEPLHFPAVVITAGGTAGSAGGQMRGNYPAWADVWLTRDRI